MYHIKSIAQYKKAYKASVQNPEQFWAEIAENFVWQKPWDKVLDWNFTEHSIKWFVNARLNITENALDRHAQKTPRKTAIVFEPNDPNGKIEKITYLALLKRVCQFANMLKANGIKKGDCVCIYMPMIPELTVAVLACARIGAIHSVVFAGFSAASLADRVNDAQAKMVITADGLNRGSKFIDLKQIVDEALVHCPCVHTVLVKKHTKTPIKIKKNRDKLIATEMAKVGFDCPAEPMDSEDMLFILYTSGSTGKPKGVVHTCGGYMVYAAYTFQNVFQYRKNDVFWCTADIGWVTGHTYMVYGPLLNGATVLMFEGVPTYPDAGRFWQVIDKHKVSIFYTAPTAIRSLMQLGLEYVTPYKLDSLRVLGTVGEPINEEAWHWYSQHIGKNNCPIVDTWWQTETGGIMISTFAGVHETQAAWAGFPLPGVQAVLLDAKGKEINQKEAEGYLAIKFPHPAMIRTTFGDHERCRQVYFGVYKNYYFTGDGAKRSADGRYRIIGRVDDVINVSGHRFGTAEIENAINEDKNAIESAVVGYPHDIKGQGIFAYVIVSQEANDSSPDEIKKSILATVSKQIGAIAKPDKIMLVSGLPKTRSGKIMRRILRKVAENDLQNLGDTSTLLDPLVVDEIIQKMNALEV